MSRCFNVLGSSKRFLFVLVFLVISPGILLAQEISYSSFDFAEGRRSNFVLEYKFLDSYEVGKVALQMKLLISFSQLQFFLENGEYWAELDIHVLIKSPKQEEFEIYEPIKKLRVKAGNFKQTESDTRAKPYILLYQLPAEAEYDVQVTLTDVETEQETVAWFSVTAPKDQKKATLQLSEPIFLIGAPQTKTTNNLEPNQDGKGSKEFLLHSRQYTVDNFLDLEFELSGLTVESDSSEVSKDSVGFFLVKFIIQDELEKTEIATFLNKFRKINGESTAIIKFHLSLRDLLLEPGPYTLKITARDLENPSLAGLVTRVTSFNIVKSRSSG